MVLAKSSCYLEVILSVILGLRSSKSEVFSVESAVVFWRAAEPKFANFRITPAPHEKQPSPLTRHSNSTTELFIVPAKGYLRHYQFLYG